MTTVVPAVDLPKPLDVGNGLVVASFGRDGCWLSVGMPHERHGFVELSGLPPFDERWRGDPAAVRRYRGWMAEDRFAFLRLELPDETRTAALAGLDANGRPVWRRTGPGWTCASTAWAPESGRLVVQRHILRWEKGAAGRATMRFRGGLSRSALAEITEINPPAELHSRTTIRPVGNRLRLSAPALAQDATITVRTWSRTPATPAGAGPRPHPSWIRTHPDGVCLSIDRRPDENGPVLVFTAAVSLSTHHDATVRARGTR